MKYSGIGIVVSALLLQACASQPTQPETPEPATSSQLEVLKRLLPGQYNNFTQAREAESSIPILDMGITPVSSGSGAVFLLEQSARGSSNIQRQLYWFDSINQGNDLVLRFAPVPEQSSSTELLNTARQRMLPGCDLPVAITSDGLVGETNAQQCRFNHPQYGHVGLTREISFSQGILTIAERLVGSQGEALQHDQILTFRQSRSYQGWAGLKLSADGGDRDISNWRLAIPFTVMDDGHVIELMDAAGDSLGYGLQLSRSLWRDDQPRILKLSVINLETEEIQGYAWSHEAAPNLGINLDWIQAGLTIQAQ